MIARAKARGSAWKESPREIRVERRAVAAPYFVAECQWNQQRFQA